ncbi:MAG: transporter [Vulcanimicrobiota bacterium]
MSVLPGILILLVFLVAAGLMFTRRLPALLALPLMAISIGLIVGCSQAEVSAASLKALIFDQILTKGASRMAGAMVTTMFGAVLSQVVMRQGIAQQFIRWAAEYAGDRKMLLGLVLFAVVAFNFSALSGLGAVIMLGSLVLPILVSSGFTPIYAATLMLLGIGLGGMFNPANWRFYVELLNLPPEQVKFYSVRVAAVLLSVSVFYLIFEGRRQSKVFAWAALNDEPEGPRVPMVALFTPILPPFLMLAFGWPDIPAFMTAILYGCLATQPRRLVANVTAAILEGLKDVGPVVALFVGLGMTLNATMDESAKAIMNPFLERVLPGGPVAYVAFFTLLAPLALYRGPFNLYGLGAGFAALMAKSTVLPPLAVMTAFMSVGQMQSVCDPTNTANVWIGQFVQVSPEKILKHTIAYVLVFILLSLSLMVSVLRVLG